MRAFTVRLTLIGILAFFGSTSFAETTTPATPPPSPSWYQVEIVAFSQIPYGEKQAETWPLIPAFSQPEQSIQLVPPEVYQQSIATQANQLPLVSADQFNLNTEVLHLSHNPNYELIGHTAWLQPISADSSLPVHIQASNNTTTLDALVYLSKKHFVQLRINAVASIANQALSNNFLQQQQNSIDGATRFALQKTLRMKTNELNYIDSPFFGILLKISAHAPPKQQDITSVLAYSTSS